MSDSDTKERLFQDDSCFIPLDGQGILLPNKLDYLFCYDPHDIAIKAAENLQQHIQKDLESQHEFGLNNLPGIGKMFGVLVVKNHNNKLGYIAAFSGKLNEVNFYPGFVPPVFDSLDPDGFYKLGEQEINIINWQIRKFTNDPKRQEIIVKLNQISIDAENEISSLKILLKQEKEKRTQARNDASEKFTDEVLADIYRQLDKESIEWHYNLKSRKKYWKEQIAIINQQLTEYDTNIDQLKTLRRQESAYLQNKLFESYSFINQYGKYKNLLDIFNINNELTPPSGAGECAAPKLFQHAFIHGYKPVAMAEFWWGKSPNSEIRKHKYYYPACNGKCKPILEHMLEGIDMDDNPMLINPGLGKSLPIVYQDDEILVINKPAEFLSVPGKNIVDSVYTRIRNLYPHSSGPLLVHRLDMSTSGILLIAKNKDAHKNLQRQFINRKVKKRYVAILKGSYEFKDISGSIKLPLRVDIDDRPRQLVCFEHGKTALTQWEWLSTQGDEHRIYFYPHTGRTHQLRVHASHPNGLNLPIKGDDLYGTRLDRLYLHAERLEFIHPTTGKAMVIEVAPEF